MFINTAKMWLSLVVLIVAALSPSAGFAQYRGLISVLVAEVDSGRILSQDNPNLVRYPASLTKLMTLYMTFSALRHKEIYLDQLVPISVHAASMSPTKLGLIPGRSRLTVREAILSLITKSANDVAVALGELVVGGGSEDNFAKAMTEQAHSMGMNLTRFANASGLPDSRQVTTAHDMAILARRIILDFPEYYPFFSVDQFRYGHRMIPNHNPMLKFYPGIEGMKTGYTNDSGYNLITSAMRSGIRLIGVVMGADTPTQRNVSMVINMDNGFSQRGIAPLSGTLQMAINASGIGRKRVRPVNRHRLAVMAAARKSVKGEPAQVADASYRRSVKKTTRKRSRVKGAEAKKVIQYKGTVKKTGASKSRIVRSSAKPTSMSLHSNRRGYS